MTTESGTGRLPAAYLSAGSSSFTDFVGTAVLDERVSVRRGAAVGAVAGRRSLRDEDVTLVGKDSVVGPRVALPAGARLEPGSSA